MRIESFALKLFPGRWLVPEQGQTVGCLIAVSSQASKSRLGHQNIVRNERPNAWAKHLNSSQCSEERGCCPWRPSAVRSSSVGFWEAELAAVDGA